MTYTCPICSRLCKTDAGLTSHMNNTHNEMTPAQWGRWQEAQAESLARRTAYRAMLESMVGKESNG